LDLLLEILNFAHNLPQRFGGSIRAAMPFGG
jgi:hypothetical protein